MIYVILLVVIVSTVLFIQKVAMKSRLELGLGRKVQDSELTSLNAWMQATPANQSATPAPNLSPNIAPALSGYNPQPMTTSPTYGNETQQSSSPLPQPQPYQPQYHSTPQANIVIAPVQSQREYTSRSATPLVSVIKILLRFTIIGRVLFNLDGVHYDYYTVDGREYSVNMQTYYQLRPGQMVEVHLHPSTGQLLGIYPAKGETNGNGSPQSNRSSVPSAPVSAPAYAPVPTQSYNPTSPYNPAFVASTKNRKWIILLVGLLVFSGIAYFVFFYSHDPKPPAGAFPGKVGRFQQSTLGVSYNNYKNLGNGKNFSTYYDAGSSGTANTEITCEVWEFPSAEEAKRGLQSKKEEAKSYYVSEGKRIGQQDETRFVTIDYAPGKQYDQSTDVAWVDGAFLKNISAHSQQIAYEFEGALRNRPPAQLIPDPPDAPPRSSIYKFDKGGVQFDLPTGWNVEKDKDGNLTIKGSEFADTPVIMIFAGLGNASFEEFTQSSLKGAREKGGEVSLLFGPVKDSINGMTHISQTFMVTINKEAYESKFDMLNVGDKPIAIMNIHSTKELTPAVEERISNLIKSIKKME